MLRSSVAFPVVLCLGVCAGDPALLSTQKHLLRTKQSDGGAGRQQHLSVESVATADEPKEFVLPGLPKEATASDAGQTTPDNSSAEQQMWKTHRLQLLIIASVSIMVLPWTGMRIETVVTVLPVIGFMVCSSLMLIVNKMTVNAIPLPVTVLAVQLLVCALGVRLAGAFGLVQLEPLKLGKAISFGATPLAFLLTLVANMKVLEFANVETFIMVRNATPLATSIMDWAFLGRELPDRYSVLALLMALAGAAGYVVADAEFKVVAYSWAAAWLAIFLFDQIYIKHVISTVPMTPWTRVYYNNFLAGVPAVVAAMVVEGANVETFRNLLTPQMTFAASMLSLSCVMGAAMSYFAFRARDALSATAFTVVGNVCKVLSVLVNVFIWDKHATQAGLAALFFCMAGSAFYRPAELRGQATKSSREGATGSATPAKI